MLVEYTEKLKAVVEFDEVCIDVWSQHMDDVPQHFPCLIGTERIKLNVNLMSGEILNWPKNNNTDYNLYIKVCDRGSYTISGYDADGNFVNREIENDYVPNDIIPGEFGDYIDLKISNGIITNWYEEPSLNQFFAEDEELRRIDS